MNKTVTLSAGSGDAWASKPVNGLFSSTGTELPMGGIGVTNDEAFTWVPFPNCPIGKGKTITSATLKVTATQTVGSGTLTVYIGCEAADNPAAPTTLADLRARVLTAAFTTAGVGPYTAGTQYTYDITAAVQEIINRSGFAMGNTIAVYIQTSITTNASRPFASSENGTYTPPKLEIVVPYFVPSGDGLF